MAWLPWLFLYSSPRRVVCSLMLIPGGDRLAVLLMLSAGYLQSCIAGRRGYAV